MNIPQAEELNVRAERLLSDHDATAALALFQDVFIQCGKSDDEPSRIQVARALCGAARCCDESENKTMASSIRQTMERRFSSDSNPKVRYYLELTIGKTTGEAPPKIEYSKSASAPRKREAETRTPTSSPEKSVEGWNDFLSSNKLAADEETETNDKLKSETTRPMSTPPSRIEQPSPTQFLRQDEVTLVRIGQIFTNAFIQNTLDTTLRVETGDLFFRLFLNETNSLICYRASFGLRKLATWEEKLSLANDMNDNVILVRFSVADDITLIADYYLPYSHGVAPFHIVNTLRLMNHVTVLAIKQHDQNNLVA